MVGGKFEAEVWACGVRTCYIFYVFLYFAFYLLFFMGLRRGIYIYNLFFLGAKGPDNILFKEDKRKQKGNGPVAINGTIAFHVLEISRMLR